MLNVEHATLRVFVDDGVQALVAAGAMQDASDLLTQVDASLRLHGHAWIRGLSLTSPTVMKSIAEALAPTLIRYPGGRIDASGDGRVQQIADPPSALPLHCELAYTPFRPDLCFFACGRPSEVGGSTLVADGARVFAALSDKTRALLRERAVRYTRVYRTRPWRLLFGVETFEQLAPLLGALPEFVCTPQADGSVHTEFVTSALTQRESTTCFANSIVGLAKGQRDFDVTWADGEPFSAVLLEELREALRSARVNVVWEAGDLVVLDNWRWLHGREAFEGERVVYSAFGYRGQRAA